VLVSNPLLARPANTEELVLPVERGVAQGAEVAFDRFTMAREHAVREFLQGALLFARRETAPVGDQLLELLLIDDAGAAATWIANIRSGILGRVRILRLA